MYDLDKWEEVFPGGCYVVFEDEHDDDRLYQMASHTANGPELRLCSDTRRTQYPDYEDIRKAEPDEIKAKSRILS